MKEDIQNIPTYSIPEVAKYLQIPVATLRNWVLGHKYKSRSGERYSEPLIAIADKSNALMSFINVAEAHVLSAIRRKHNVPMVHIRQALNYVGFEFKTNRPLLDKNFETDGVNLFVDECGRLINLNRSGQFAMKDILRKFLNRIDRDENNKPLRIYPLLPMANENEKSFMIDPKVSFGRLVIAETGIPVDVIEERFNAGDTIEMLAKDYGCKESSIEKAIQIAA